MRPTLHHHRCIKSRGSLRSAAVLITFVWASFLSAGLSNGDDGWQRLLERRVLLSPDGGDRDEPDPITTDRPDFTEASSTVGEGVLQLESGYTYLSDEKNGKRSRGHSVPETLVRYGAFADWLELRAAWNFAIEDVGGSRSSGAEDLYVGAKFALLQQEGAIPELAIVPQLTVPTGTSAFSAHQTLPGVNVLYGWDISEVIATGGSTQVNRTVDVGTGDAYAEWAQSWTINYTFTERFGAYTEWFAFFPQNAFAIATEHYADGGFTFRPTENHQLDVRGGLGMNEAAADYFVGIGYSVRFR